MKLKFRIIIFITCFAATVVWAKENDMVMSYKIKMDNQVFSISTPILPDRQFFTHRLSIPLNDDSLFEKSNRVMCLSMQWTYRTGLLRKVAGEVAMKVMLQSSPENNATSDHGLKQELLADFKRELSDIGYDGSPIEFEKVIINGDSWLRYKVPILGILEYSKGVSDKRFLTVKFVFTDNTGEPSPAWWHEAKELTREMIGSMQIES